MEAEEDANDAAADGVLVGEMLFRLLFEGIVRAGRAAAVIPAVVLEADAVAVAFDDVEDA